jgi:hypothetical protein
MANPGPSSSVVANALNNIQLLFVLRGANMQTTQDQIFTRVFSGYTWDPFFITANYASGAISGSCQGGIYPQASKGGTGIVGSTQSYAGLTTGPLTHVNVTIQATTTTFITTPYLSLTTANGAPLTADFFIFGACYD